ncbi:hypothetical protein SUGI_0854390 [Cryptomeria japonica]|nr:hypothetical protein SUGI_0854390 [Cryptomeria japonica]
MFVYRYNATTVLALLQEVAKCANVKIDWNTLVKNTTTGITNAQEYQMLWHHLAYCKILPDKYEDGAQPLDADSDLDFEIEPYPPVGAEALAEAAACVKVLEASGIPKSSGQPSHSVVEAPLTINIPSSTSVSDVHTNNQQSVISTQGMNITVPVSIQKQPFPAVPSSDGIEGNVLMSSVHPIRKKRKLWTPEEDKELIAAVQKCGEGNWSSILKGAFKHDRTASQLSQRWSLIRKRHAVSNQSNLGNSSTFSGSVDLPHSTAQVVPVTGSISSGASVTVTAGPTMAVTGNTTGTTAVTIPSSSLTLPTASTGSGSSLIHSTAGAGSDSTALQLSQGHQGLEQAHLHGIAGSSSVCATLPSVKSRPKSKKQAANKSSTGRLISPMPPPATTAAMSSVSTPAKTAVSIPGASPGSGRYGINPATQPGISEALGHGSSMPLSGPHPLVQAAAVAAGARIAPPSAAASLLKAAQSGNVVHFGVGGIQLAKSGYATQAGTVCGTADSIRSSNGCISSSARASCAAGSNMRASNVHYIRTGSVSSPPVYTGGMPSVQRLPASQPKGHTVKAATTGPSIPQSSKVNLLTGTTLPSKQASESCGASQAQSSGTSPSNISVVTSKGNLKSQIAPSITEASQTFQSDLQLKPTVSDTILSVPPILTSTSNQMSTEQVASVLPPAVEICSGASSSLLTSNSPCPEIDPCQFTNAPADISSVPTLSENVIVNDNVTIQEDKIIELKNNYSSSTTNGSSQHQACSERHTSGETAVRSERHMPAETAASSERHIDGETAASSERHIPGETAASSECADVRATIEVHNENGSEKIVEIECMPGSPPIASHQNVSSSAQNDILMTHLL